MAWQDKVEVRHRGRLWSTYLLGEGGLLVGGHPGCDIVLRLPVADTPQYYLYSSGGTVRLRHLTPGGDDCHLPLEQAQAITGGFSLTRRSVRRKSRRPKKAQPLGSGACLEVRVGSPQSERRYRLGARGLLVGREPSCDVQLDETAISPFHAYLRSVPGGTLIRNLSEGTGVWSAGALVRHAVLAGVAHLRVGKTDLYIHPSQVKRVPPSESGQVIASAALRHVYALARRYASLPWPVLIRGESGVGKEGLARALHAQGPRANHPFVAINVAALSDHLLASELFGHRRGAFTGAEQERIGMMVSAGEGTLFLDEVGELSPGAQAQLLRALETRMVRPLGSEQERPFRARIIAATHQNLEEMVQQKLFREDLYYRMAQLQLRVPPLRDRPADIDALTAAFVRESSDLIGHRSLTPSAHAALRSYTWPGNVRQLRNVIRAACASSPSARVDREDLAPWMRVPPSALSTPGRSSDPEIIATALREHAGNLSQAARSLGVARSTLRDRVRRYGLTNDAPSGLGDDATAAR